MPTGFDIFAAVFAANALPGGVAANRNRNVVHPTAEVGEVAQDDAQKLQRLKTGPRRSQSRSSSTPPPSVLSR